MRPAVAAAPAVLLCASLLGAAPAEGDALPDRMADPGPGRQLITAVAPTAAATTGTVTWWDRRDGRWVRAGSAPARFGADGLVEGAARTQGTDTTPTGLFPLPYAFGVKAAPPGTTYAYRPVREDSWWCQDNASRAYNRWTEPRAADCRARQAEHLVSYGQLYAHALVIGFNYRTPVRGRGAGVFLHVRGAGPTAGCVSVPEDAMRRILRWARARGRPHIAVGTASGPTAITRY
ncbi:L,D-transpeptidase family protein [Streptomyces cinereospinus]|uniref:L,D-transpeptidase family protein n=1 Tax=Streptomyces cinereospinus TaxID=285561 RepID=A0ABV5N046_9ACTN